ncbi:MAG: NAD-dependent epimerase/dehydratase family protein [Dysgonamonadaceae bacterium]|nr:NAD-dependent epimerase/dehydratase family protein [Dysgonamonadaceae bacterium]
MKILITGINGFVGSNFTQKWSNEHTLYGIDIRQPNVEGVVQTYSWDELQDIPKVDAIVHLAGKAHDTKNESLAEDYFEINVGLTKKIFEHFLQSDTRTFVFFSSVKAAKDSTEGKVLKENVFPEPVGPYGESKIKAEEYLLSKLPEVESLNKRLFIVRPCMIHGPGNKGNLNLLYNVVSKGVPWPLGAYENRRSFCSIDNIAYVVQQLIVKENIENGIYHVCDDEALSTNELIALIALSVNKSPRIWKLPKGLMNTFASVGGALRLPLTKERLTKLTENYVVSNEKVKNALGIDKMPVGAEEGLTKTLKSFQDK